MTTRIERLREYRRMEGPKGEASDKANLDYWSERATENSKIAPRATNKSQAMAVGGGRSDINHIGGSFMPNVRRGDS